MNSAAPTQAAGVPRPVLIGAAALVAFTFVAAWTGKTLGVGDVRMPNEAAYQVLQLAFDDSDDGAVLVHDASNGALLQRVAPGTNGFLRGALRGFARERMRAGGGRSEPFTLTRWRDGTLSLQDQTTGRRIDLDAFGATQAGDFAQLFALKEDVK